MASLSNMLFCSRLHTQALFLAHGDRVMVLVIDILWSRASWCRQICLLCDVCGVAMVMCLAICSTANLLHGRWMELACRNVTSINISCVCVCGNHVALVHHAVSFLERKIYKQHLLREKKTFSTNRDEGALFVFLSPERNNSGIGSRTPIKWQIWTCQPRQRQINDSCLTDVKSLNFYVSIDIRCVTA